MSKNDNTLIMHPITGNLCENICATLYLFIFQLVAQAFAAPTNLGSDNESATVAELNMGDLEIGARIADDRPVL
jgi:hypothetical protein